MGFPEAYYAGERTVEQVAYEEGRKPGHLGVWKGRHSSYKSLYRYERFIGHRDNLKSILLFLPTLSTFTSTFCLYEPETANRYILRISNCDDSTTGTFLLIVIN